MGRTAIILGASGATGTELLTLLLRDTRYSKVKVFVRRKLNKTNLKIEEHITDLFNLEAIADDFIADEVYCCIGTTKSQTPDKETYHKIDYGIPAEAAKLAKRNNIPVFIVISAIGADKDSSIFYNRTKGEMQEAVIKAGILKTHILQPSLIVADRKDKRITEKLASGFMRLLNPLLFGGAARFKSIKAGTIAKTMVWLANNNYPKVIVPSDKIQEIAHNNPTYLTSP